ncbi:MAG: alpha/beta hydrolase [Aeromicrobium sp.]
MSIVSTAVTTARGVVMRGLFGLPAHVVERLAGSPVVIDGRRLHPEMQLLLKLQKLEGPPAETVSISRGRRIIAAQSQLAGGTQPIGAVTGRSIDGPGGRLPLRFYTPRGLTGTSPALVFFHGGGWIYGDLESHDALCRVLAEQAQVRVVAVDYRLAPEAPFPAAVEDAMAAWTWVADHAHALGIDPERIAVGGDSAGGNLAAIVAQQTVRAGLASPAFQLLIYPATDFAERAPSRTTYREGFYLTKDFMDLAEETYLVGGEDRADPRLSPLYGDVSGVAPAYVVTAGFDPLLDEGNAYAAALKSAGVEVEHLCEDGLIHGFANMVAVGREAPQAVRRMSAALRRGLAR